MDVGEIGKEITKPSFDLSTDYAEIALDEFFDDGLLKEIPVVKTLVAVIKTGAAVKERFFIKKLLVFLRELHTGTVKEDVQTKFRSHFDSDEKFRKKVTEQVMLIVDQLDSIRKAKISAHLFRAYINGVYDWERYVALNSSLKNIMEMSFPFLQVVAKNNFGNINANPTITELAKALDPKTGQMDFSVHREFEGVLMASGVAYIHGSYFGITSLGKDLYIHGISKVLDENPE